MIIVDCNWSKISKCVFFAKQTAVLNDGFVHNFAYKFEENEGGGQGCHANPLGRKVIHLVKSNGICPSDPNCDMLGRWNDCEYTYILFQWSHDHLKVTNEYAYERFQVKPCFFAIFRSASIHKNSEMFIFIVLKLEAYYAAFIWFLVSMVTLARSLCLMYLLSKFWGCIFSCLKFMALFCFPCHKRALMCSK